MRFRHFFAVVSSAASDWSADNAMRLSAALAYYAIFSLAPLLVITISIAGLVFEQEAARGQISQQLRQLAGSRAADALQVLLQGTSRRNASLSATFIGLILLLFGASGVFNELKDALNTIWGVAIKPGRPWYTMIRDRFISFTLVLGVGFLLLVSLLVSAALAAVATFMSHLLTWPPIVLHAADLVLSLMVVTVLFASIFKVLPNVEIRWSDAWIGGAVTSFLFTIGKILIGFYIGTSSVASYYGAAGSAIVLLLWVYYSACILFFGAEFTKSYARQYGGGILPDKRAMFRSRATAGECPDVTKSPVSSQSRNGER